jgi:hypothetical protein
VTARSGTPVEALRRLFNRLDRAIDRRSLREVVRITRETGQGAEPVTARVAFQACLKVARSLDRGARLRLIAAPKIATLADGTSRAWDFHFHLPRRRGVLACRWELPFDAAADDFGPARLDVTATPFPAPGSPMLTLVDQGKMLYRQLNGLWRMERRRARDLPHRFRDSDEVVAELAAQGLDATLDEVTLATRCDGDAPPVWTAATRDRTWETRFA